MFWKFIPDEESITVFDRRLFSNLAFTTGLLSKCFISDSNKAYMKTNFKLILILFFLTLYFYYLVQYLIHSTS